jgi:hypothetical protein
MHREREREFERDNLESSMMKDVKNSRDIHPDHVYIYIYVYIYVYVCVCGVRMYAYTVHTNIHA